MTEDSVKFPNVLEILSEETGLLVSDVQRIILSASTSYKTYSIPKRSGGMRVISQPSRLVKTLQRAFIKCVLKDLSLHSSAIAYRKGK